MSILEIKNLKFSYGDNNLFNSLDMKLEMNDHLGLIGLNGSGKTTLLNLISRKIDQMKVASNGKMELVLVIWINILR